MSETRTTQASSWKSIILAALVAALPGIYSAWDASMAAKKAKALEVSVTKENKVRLSQEKDLQDYAKANKIEIAIIKSNYVTKEMLLQQLIKLSKEIDQKIQENKTRSPVRGSMYWERKYRDLKRENFGARQRRLKALFKRLKRPKLKPSYKLRISSDKNKK